MPLFRRSDAQGERSAADRERARLEREARRRGVPVEELLGSEEVAPPAEAVPPPPADPEPAPPEPVVGSDSHSEPEPTTEPVLPEEDLTWVEPEPAPPAPEPEPEPEPPAPEPEPEPEPPAPEPVVGSDSHSELEPTTAEEPEPTAEHRAAAPAGDELPPRDLEPPPLPAPSASRPRPRPPRRRYAQPDARRSPAQGPVRRRRSWLARIAAVLVIVLAVGVLWFLFNLFQPGKGDGTGRVAVEIPQGATAREVGDLLADRDVVSSGFYFDLRAWLAGKREDFKAGRYTLAHDMSYGAALDALTEHEPAAPPTVKITIPEGRSRTEIAPTVKEAGISGSYLAASKRHKGFDPREYGAPRSTRSLEGFLFPATYEMREGQATARRLVGHQLEAFRQNFDTVSMRAAKRRNLTPYDVLIIASMVEREAQVPKERPLIAAVIYNRLRERMPLGIDATTRYDLGVWHRPLRVSELERDTPFNTRTRLGLPPTPIGNPGLDSIKAAAKPADVDYLYYVVKPNTCGEHSFSETDAEFQKDVAAYEAARAKNGGKSPDTCDD
ncbi:MAG TPA: endolytic transglycosylase MltG [Capillimicrobium sp.]|nr:endolytic transglycosylase MltG [Capillimicrobium sp.]